MSDSLFHVPIEKDSILNLRWMRTTRAHRTIIIITAVALGIHLVFLGQRIAHFAEIRHGFWTLQYMRTGSFHCHYSRAFHPIAERLHLHPAWNNCVRCTPRLRRIDAM